MNSDAQLPNDDRDLSLARHIGAQLEQGTSPTVPNEADLDEQALFQHLSVLKARQTEAGTPSEDTSHHIWTRISADLALGDPDPAIPKPAGMRLIRAASAVTRTPRFWYSMAATILILVGFAWFLQDADQEPVLLAASETEILLYTTADGSTITLRPRSKLYGWPDDDTAARFRLVGEGFFSVTPNPDRTFQVDTEDARVAVLGTRFNLSTWGATTAVYLQEGRVRFSALRSDDAVVLTPGQQSRVADTGQLTTPEIATEAEFTDWLDGNMTFAQRPLHYLIAELEHHYGVTLDVPSPLAGETYSGRILLGDPEQSLSDLAVVMGGRFVDVAQDTYRFVPE